MRLIKIFRIEAAHTTPWRDDPARLHGHSFQIEVAVAGPCDEALGWVMDYADIGRAFESLFAQLDHQFLDEVAGMERYVLPGLERWLDDRLRDEIPLLDNVRVTILGDQMFAPKLRHADAAARLPARIRFGFEAAHALPNVPKGHKCRQVHGHSFTVEAGGRDAESLTHRLQEIYEALDHRCLNEIDGLRNPTSEMLSQWIWQQLAPSSPGLEAVVVAETCTARCVYHGD